MRLTHLVTRAYIMYSNFSDPSVITNAVVTSVKSLVTLQVAKNMNAKENTISFSGVSKVSAKLVLESPWRSYELPHEQSASAYIHDHYKFSYVIDSLRQGFPNFFFIQISKLNSHPNTGLRCQSGMQFGTMPVTWNWQWQNHLQKGCFGLSPMEKFSGPIRTMKLT